MKFVLPKDSTFEKIKVAVLYFEEGLVYHTHRVRDCDFAGGGA